MKPSRYVRPFRLNEMEPLLPMRFDASIRSLARVVTRNAERIGEELRPGTRARITELIRATEAHYSSVLADYGAGQVHSNAVLECRSRALVELDVALENRRDVLGVRLCSTTILKWLHAELFAGQHTRGPRRTARLSPSSSVLKAKMRICWFF